MIVSPNGTITSLESSEEREKSMRRAKFEIDYKKRMILRKKIGNAMPELESFSLGVEKQIAEFRAKKRVV